MVDGAVSRSQNTGVVGVICHEGLYLGAVVCIYPGIIDPAILETIACREVLNFAEDLNIQKMCTSSDCQGAIDDITRGSGGNNAVVVREIKEFTSNFSKVHFMHEGRKFTIEAHNLARAATMLAPGRHLWLINPPNFVLVPMSILNQ
jgi:hypothetical protein